ncbi:glutathione S-transferase [Roseivivax isoporae]|uniref:Glutathione S-transferase n=1 Tax=Roseivivax isoporae LMG 25204 TaxID=1449351 RepID=X7FDK0_9RHOB|nr:glutathione S-transferase [Roseivivax isoporae]ETX30114.1 glutathione S-transferase [Roseivivax isoporae LMG 25204]
MDRLFVGDFTYSSWSLRGWLIFAAFGLPVELVPVRIYDGDIAAGLAPVAPARLVPALLTAEGEPLGETLAIAETMAERHPEAGHWPRDPAARMRARWLVSEMHAGFGALRGACPMDVSRAYAGFEPPEGVLADLARLDLIWSAARARFGGNGPWLCGAYSLADAFFAPVATRIATYGLPVGGEAAAYVAAHLAHAPFRQWRAMAMAETRAASPYDRDLPLVDWPGPAPLPAHALAEGTPENAACPFTGAAPVHLAEIGGRTLGFADAVARDKAVADPEAWPEVAALLR